MEETQRLLNPWMLHLQKLGLELKCPLCLQLFNRPMLLPCNHIFCNLCMPKSVQFGSDCPACKQPYVDREVKPAPFMENIVNIYRNLDATFNANLIHPVCSDAGRASSQRRASFKLDADEHSRKEHVEAAQEGNSSNGQSTTLQSASHTLLNGSPKDLVARNIDKFTTPESGQKQEFLASGGDKPSLSNSMGQVVAEKHIMNEVEGVGFIQLEQLSPPLSSDSKDMDGDCSDPNSSHGNAIKYPPKRQLENDAYGANPKSNSRCNTEAKCHTTEIKRQKITNNDLIDTGSVINGRPQTKALASENVATVSCNLETKFVKPASSGQSSACLDPMDLKKSPCAFCHTSRQTEGSGPLLAYASGKEVVGDLANSSKVTHVHEKCITWTPRIFFEGGLIKNLESEVSRANKLKCSSCGKKGAGLGCYMRSCQRSYHVPCAYDILDCRWDCDDFLLLCPKHVSFKFPREQKSKAGKQDTAKSVCTSTHLNPCTALSNVGKDLVLCGSALSSEEKCHVVEFARSSGAVVSKCWRPSVTHVIAATDSDGACTRTLKVLMAILNGKWILTLDWVKACVEAGRVVDEEPYEVQLDTHGCAGGPKAGRLRVLNNAPKLFNNLKFHLTGYFIQAFKNDLLNLITTAGGTIIENKDELRNAINATALTLVVYNTDLSVSEECKFEDEGSIKFERLMAAQDIAKGLGPECYVVGHSGILESIAACSLRAITSSE